MARVAHEGKIHVYFLTAEPASVDHAERLDEITSAELSAGLKLPQITADGVDTAPTNNRASIDMIDTGRISEFPGTHGMSVNMKFARDDDEDDDVAWELFEHATYGFIVVSRFGIPQVGGRLEVHEGHSFEPQMQASASNTFQQYTVEFALVDWNKKATLVAS